MPLMPFPLAHPAAVLPLRRFCPRRLDFPALVIGSLSPDVGYSFGPDRLGAFSHRFLAGSFGFCLPLGFVLVRLFYLVRPLAVKRLPTRHRQILEPLCRRPGGSPFVLVASLLFGAWTPCFLDSVTNGNGWLACRLPMLQANVMAGNFNVRVYDLLYSVCTFVGVACVALSFQNWFERVSAAPGWIFPGFKWVSTLLMTTLTLLLSLANQGSCPSLGIGSIGILSTMLVMVFLAATGSALRDPQQEPKNGTKGHA